MKNLLFPIFILLFVFSSCHKEEIILDKKDVIDSPKEIDNALFLGRVLDNYNEVLSGVEINIYQKGEKIGAITNDSDGYYTTEGLNLEIGYDVTFEVISENHLRKIRRVKAEKENKIDFSIHEKTGNPNEDAAGVSNPGDTSLVKIYGTFTDINGKPLVGALTWITWYDLDMDTIPQSYKDASEYSDQNGYFELLIDSRSKIHVFSVMVGNKTQCKPLVAYETKEIYNEDYEIIELPDIEYEIYKTDLHGKFLDCNGNPVQSGYVYAVQWFTVPNSGGAKSPTSYKTTEFDSEGNFVIENIASCYLGDDSLVVRFRTDNNFGVDTSFLKKIEQNILKIIQIAIVQN